MCQIKHRCPSAFNVLRGASLAAAWYSWLKPGFSSGLHSMKLSSQNFTQIMGRRRASPLAQRKESSCNTGSASLIPGLGRSPEGGHGSPLQYSCWENQWTEKPDGSTESQRVELNWIDWACTMGRKKCKDSHKKVKLQSHTWKSQGDRTIGVNLLCVTCSPCSWLYFVEGVRGQ